MKKSRQALALLVSGMLVLGFTGCNGHPTVKNTGSSKAMSAASSGVSNGISSSDAQTASGGSSSGASQAASKGNSKSPATGGAITADDEKKIPGLSGIKADPKINFNGGTVKVGYWAEHMKGTGTDEASLRARKLNQKIEQTYNCKLEFVNVENGKLPALKTSIMAGKPMVDMFAIQGVDTFNSYYRANCLTGLEDYQYVDLNNTSIFYVPELTKFNNKHYGLTTRIFSWYQTAFGTALLVNFTLTAKAGYTADALYAMQDSGQWTWANFEKVCTDVIRANPGVIGLTDLSSKVANDNYNFDQSFEFYNGLLYSNNTDWIAKSGNQFSFTGGSAAAMAVLNQYTTWANPNTGFIKFQEDNWGTFKSSKSIFLATVYSAPFAYRDQIVGNDSVGMMYFPKGPAATEYVSKQMQQTYVVIPQGVSNRQAIGAVFNAINQPLYTDAESRGLNRMDASRASSIQKSVETMDTMFKSEQTWTAGASVFGIAAGIGYTKDMNKAGWFDYVYKVAKGEMQASEAVNAFSGRATSVLNSTYK